jgi:predicted GIY-YIG superfamily endonuclease
MRPLKRFVYVLRSSPDPSRHYTGVTSNLRARLAAHNRGECHHTSYGKPWVLDVVIAFRDEARAMTFERYLKSGSGVAFAQRHLRAPEQSGNDRPTRGLESAVDPVDADDSSA